MEADTNANEITSMITNQEHIRNDMVEITNVVKNLLNEKYILKINELVSQHREKVVNNPTKEVMLMYALKPFMKKEAQVSIDRMIELMNIMDAARGIGQEIRQVSLQRKNDFSDK